MEKTVKMDISAITHGGMTFRGNREGFYLDGRHVQDEDGDSVRVSVEMELEECLLSVYDNMDIQPGEKKTVVSMAKELTRFHDQYRGRGWDLQSKVKGLAGHIDGVLNLLHSMYLDEPERVEKPSLTGLVVHDGQVAVLQCGKARAYLFRDGSLKPMQTDPKKAERLLKMGILTDEQAKMLSGKNGNGGEGTDSLQVNYSDARNGDVFLLCSDGVADYLDEEQLADVLNTGGASWQIAAALRKEAIGAGSRDNITIMAVAIGNVKMPVMRQKESGRRGTHLHHKQESIKKRNEIIKTAVAAIVTLACLAAIIAVVYVFSTSKTTEPDSTDESTLAQVSAPITVETTQETEPLVITPTFPDSTQSTTTQEGQDQESGDEPTAPSDAQPDDTSDQESKTYIVKEGDTLQKISYDFYGTIKKYELIMKANNMTDANSLKVGQKLIIPKE